MNTNYNNLYSDYIGASGTYSITDYIDNTSNLLSSNIKTTSNILDTKINNTSNILDTNIYNTSNTLQTQITATSNLIFKDDDLNTIVKITAQNPTYPISGDPKEMRFLNVNDEYLTKIIQTGELFVYHPVSITPVGYAPAWWSVEGKIAFAITETQGLRFDVTNLQAATGASAITDTATASSAVASSGAGLAAAGTAGATAGGLIAGGDYGAVAVGLAGGALFTTLGYLSYQAQIQSNLSNNGFITQGTQVGSNMSNAYLLLADNISNINIAKGFINCNIQRTQIIPNLNITSNLFISNINISNIFVSSNNLCNTNINQGFINSNIQTQQLIPNLITSNINITNNGNINGVGTIFLNVCQANSLSTSLNTNVGFPTSNLTGGLGDKILLRYGSATTYPISIGIDENYSLWNSINYNNPNTAFNWYINSNIKMSLKNDRLDVNTIIYQNGKTLETFTQETILINTPNVAKKYGFNFTCSSSVLIGATTYFKYDIDLRLYTITKTNSASTPYRIFNIKLFITSAYFEVLNSGIPNILQYDIYMSNPANNGTPVGNSGINICANGFPLNYRLNQINPTFITLVRTANFNYLSVLSTVNNTICSCIIEDLLN